MGNRKLKFRAWNVDSMCYSDERGSLECFFAYFGNEYSDEPVMQYAGIKDKNGKEIYEGDIVRFDGVITADDSFSIEPNGYVFDGDQVFEVIFGDEIVQGFTLKFNDDEEWKYKRDVYTLFKEGEHTEVIGNIYENPELLESA